MCYNFHNYKRVYRFRKCKYTELETELMKFAVLSDIHYFSRQMITDKTDTGLMLRPAMSESALASAAARTDIDTLLLTGDLTDQGDMASHRDMVQILRSIQKTGKRVFVLTATHDFHHHKAYVRKQPQKVRYRSTPWDEPFFDPEKADFRALAQDEFQDLPDEELIPALEPAATPTDLWNLYYEFGPRDAIGMCPSSYSYCVALDDDTWCLMLNDSFRNEEAMHDISPTYSPETLRWIDAMVKAAKQQDKFLFACTHHPLLPPSPGYRIGGSNRDMRSSQPGHMLADIGINLVLSGHSHFCDVGFLTSDSGNTLCDITTPSVRFYPPRYRLVELQGKAHKISIECVPTPIPAGFDLPQDSLEAYFADSFYREYEDKIARLPAPLNKLVRQTTVGTVCRLFPGAKRMSPEQYAEIKEKKVFDIIINCALNLQSGDGQYTPDTPEYQFMMGLASVLDSIIDTQPFSDIRSKKLKGYSLSQIIEPLLFNNSVPDAKAAFDFTVVPSPRTAPCEYKSAAGPVLMAILCVLAVPLSLLLPPIAILALPIKTVVKSRVNKVDPPKPERY